jgi:hypothetical protein
MELGIGRLPRFKIRGDIESTSGSRKNGVRVRFASWVPQPRVAYRPEIGPILGACADETGASWGAVAPIEGMGARIGPILGANRHQASLRSPVRAAGSNENSWPVV